MGLKDKLINFFKNTKNLFAEPIIEIKEIEESQPERIIKFPEQIPNYAKKHSYHYTTKAERTKNFLRPDQLYSSKSTKKSPKVPNYTFNYNYTPPQVNKSPVPDIQIIKPNLQDQKNNYIPESKHQKQKSVLQVDKKKEKEKPLSKLSLKSFGEYVVRNRTISSQDSSLKLIVPSADKQMLILKSKNIDVIRSSNYLKVEEGDFVANLNNVNKNIRSFSVAIYRKKETALTSNSFFVFRTKNEILNRDFLELLIQDQRFDEKLSFIAFKYSKNNQISWESLEKNLFLNIPNLKAQQEILEKKKALQELIEVKKSICRELDEWMKNYFYSLSKDEKLITKNFKELFSIERRAGLSVPKLQDLQNQLGKFIFSSFKKLIVESCELCNCDFCESDKLLLSAKVYEEDEQKHILNLWVGCVGFASSSHFIVLTPHEALGIPYSYWLLRENFNNLIKSIPSITSKRTVSTVELKNCYLDLLPETKIKEFNNMCKPIFEYQQALEEEIYKLTKLQEGEIDTFLLRTFSKRISWDLSR